VERCQSGVPSGHVTEKRAAVRFRDSGSSDDDSGIVVRQVPVLFFSLRGKKPFRTVAETFPAASVGPSGLVMVHWESLEQLEKIRKRVRTPFLLRRRAVKCGAAPPRVPEEVEGSSNLPATGQRRWFGPSTVEVRLDGPQRRGSRRAGAGAELKQEKGTFSLGRHFICLGAAMPSDGTHINTETFSSSVPQFWFRRRLDKTL